MYLLMKKSNTFPLVLIVSMALILGDMSSITYAQDYTQFNLAEGSKMRLGKGRINDIAYSQDGNRLAVATPAGIWIYDAHTGAERDILLGHTHSVNKVVYAPDGTTLASGSVDATVRLWDVNRGTLLKTFTPEVADITSLAFSPDGATLACGGYKFVRLLDAVSGVSKATLKASTHMVNTVAFSPDGRTLASGSWDTPIHLWDAISGQLKATLTGHTGAVQRVAFSPDGRTLVSTSRDGTIRLWDAVAGKLKDILARDPNQFHSVAFSPDGQTIAGGSYQRLYLVDAVSGASKVNHDASMDMIHSLVFSPDGTTLASSDGTEVRLRDPISGDHKTTLIRHIGRVNSVAFSPDGTTLASGNSDTTICLWDAVNGHLKATLIGHTNIVSSVAFSPDGTTLASGGSGQNGTILLWDVVSRKPKATLTEHQFGVWCLAFSPDGTTLASGGSDRNGTILLWDVVSGKPKATPIAHTAGVESVAFSPNGTTLASAGGSTIRFWDVASGKPKATPIAHDGVGSVAFSPDGRTLASGGEESVKLWDAATGAYKAEKKGASKGIVFSPDGATLATPTLWAYDVQLLDAATGALKTIFESNSFGLNSLAFSPDSRMLAAGNGEGFIILWGLTPSLLQPQEPISVQPRPNLPSMVRLIYFFPSDATRHPNIEIRLDSLIKQTQQFYAEQMAHHGFGRKTFTFEKDGNGNAVVHHLKGLRTAAEYTVGDYYEIMTELENRLDMSQHLYLIALDASLEGTLGSLCGVAVTQGSGTGNSNTFEMSKDNRRAMIYAFGECHSVGTTAHELGHLFGLGHDYRDPRYVMNHGASTPRLSYWAAEWLNVHPALNPGQPASNNITTIDVLSPRSSRLQFQVADADGIHQAQLIVTENDQVSFCNGSSVLHRCQALNGKADITFELTATEASTEATLQIIDMHGTITGRSFLIEQDSTTRVEDVNKDGIVNVLDLTLVASNLGKRGQNDADVNRDGIVNILDLTLVAAAIGEAADNQ